MKKTWKSIALLVGLAAAATGANAQDYKGFIERWDAYRQQVKIDKNDRDAIRIDSTTFDEKAYLALFPALRLDPQRVFRCDYSCDGFSGSPHLYAAETGKAYEKALKRYKKPQKMPRKEWVNWFMEKMGKTKEEAEQEYKRTNTRRGWVARFAELPGKSKREGRQEYKAMVEGLRSNLYLTDKPDRHALELRYAIDSLNAAARHVVPEDSGMGYLQYVVFSEYGDNFALYWHSNYGRTEVIYSPAQLGQWVEDNRQKRFNVDFKEEEMLPYLEQDLSPRVEMDGDRCRVTLHVFVASGGLQKRVYEIPREAPHRIALVEEETLVESHTRGFY